MSMLTPDNLRIADAVIREIRDMVRLRLDQPGRRVNIRFGAADPYREGLWDAGLASNCGCTGGPLGDASETLAKLYASIVDDFNDGDRWCEEDRRAREDDDASV